MAETITTAIGAAIDATTSVTTMITSNPLFMTMLGFGFVKGGISIFGRAKRTAVH